MTDFNDAVDFKSLEKELTLAVAKDAKYQRENDAKFRAIHQKVQSYEEFRDIVEASHLRPLDKEDKIGGMSYQKWNSFSTHQPGHTETADSKIDNDAIKQPQTNQEFMKTWKRQCTTSEAKYRFLVNVDKEALFKCFAVECPMGEIISCVHSNEKNWKHGEILLVFGAMRKAKRFRLLLDFLSPGEQTQLHDIFANISKTMDQIHLNELESMAQDYKVNLGI